MGPLAGRTVLVTGAQQGIGRASAIALGAAGADVVVAWHDDQDGAEHLAEAIERAGTKALLVRADLTDLAAARSLVETAWAWQGRLHALVNNAGIFPRSTFLEMDEALWDGVLDLNLKVGAFLAQDAARRMVTGGVRGAIVNMVSMAVRGTVRGAHYSASKGGLLSLTRAVALELAPHGIRCNAIAPGVIDTAQPRRGFSEEEVYGLARDIPLGRIGRPEEIAAAVVFLASDQSSFMTGQVMHINGGQYMP